MIRLAIAAGSYEAADQIAQRLRLLPAGWRYLQGPADIYALRHTLVVVNPESLLELHPYGDAIYDALRFQAARGALVLAHVDPDLYPLHRAPLPNAD